MSNPNQTQQEDFKEKILDVTTSFIDEELVTPEDIEEAKREGIDVCEDISIANIKSGVYKLDNVIKVGQHDLDTLTKIDSAVRTTDAHALSASVETIDVWGKVLQTPLHTPSLKTVVAQPQLAKEFLLQAVAKRKQLCQENIASLNRYKGLATQVLALAREELTDEQVIPELGTNPETSQEATEADITQAQEEGKAIDAQATEQGEQEAQKAIDTSEEVQKEESDSDGQEVGSEDSAQNDQEQVNLESTDQTAEPEGETSQEDAATTEEVEPEPEQTDAPEQEKQSIKISLESLREKLGNKQLADYQAKPILEDIFTRLGVQAAVSKPVRSFGREGIIRASNSNVFASIDRALAIVSDK